MFSRLLLAVVVGLVCAGAAMGVRSWWLSGTRDASAVGQQSASARPTSVGARLPVAQAQHSGRTPRASVAADPLAGVTVGIDPGHNGRNYTDVAFIGHQVWNGRELEACNTTGTATDAGYSESLFNFQVAGYLAADLRAAGARVVLTRNDNAGVGPCVDDRARTLNRSGAAVAIDIHADGGPASGRGFTILEPVPDQANSAVVARSRSYGTDLRDAFLRTGMPTSTYDGDAGINFRDDLAGLNLTTVPQVLIECGNMRNSTDAALLTSPRFQQQAARSIMSGMRAFLQRGPG
ncbi:MAG: N-acetylmuramoyl-L-alanine amidase [Marmoricola sp.]